MIKKIAIALSGVLIVALAIFLIKVQKEERALADKNAEWKEARLPYEMQKKQYEEELDDLLMVYEADKQPKASMQFLFTDLDSQVYSVCYPAMEKMGFVGVLALSETQLPGKEGCITVEQFREMTDAGWTTCIHWDTQNAVNKWWPKLQKEIEKLEIEVGTAAYFPNGTYSAELDAKLQDMGLSVAITGRGDNESPLQSQYEEGIWHLGAIGFMSMQPKIWMNEAIAQDANITFLVGFQEENEKYNEESFDAMIKYCQPYNVSGDLIVGSVEDAKTHYSIRAMGVSPEQEAKFNEEKAVLEAKIAEVEAQLEEIDARYE